jgi:MFS family permease
MTTAPARPDPYAAVRHPGFVLYLLANWIATLGQEMQSVAVGWELYERTHSGFALGLVGLAQIVPFVFLVLPAGHLADRFDGLRILLGTHALLLLVALGLAGLSRTSGPVVLMYALLGLAGAARAFAMPARWAILPQLVPVADFRSAVTWRSNAWHIAALLGPALGGRVLVEFRAPAPAYLLNAGASAAVLVLLAAIRPGPAEKATGRLSLGTLLAGVRFVLDRELLLSAMTLDLFAVLLGGATVLLPIFARDILRVGPSGLGWLRTAPSLGALAMGLLLLYRPPVRHTGRMLLANVAGFGLATIVFGLSHSYILSLVMLFLTGAFDGVSVVIRSTLVQTLTPDAMRGRVSAVNAVFVGLSNDLGGFESGLAARFLGPVGSVVLGGFGSLAVVLGVAARWPRLARLDHLDASPDAA